jgi:dolichol-phosphate mannosyltransferase
MVRSLDNTLLTLLVPIFNEEQNIPLLLDRLSEVLRDLVSYEVLFVDDGSTDFSLAQIKKAREKADNIYFISFSKNFGHQKALKAGIDHCRGNIIVSLDGDLQHPPELIPEMLSKWQDGFDVVYTCRKDTKATGLFKRTTATLFYRLINLISKVNLKPGVADFRLIDQKALRALKSFSEQDLFFRGIVANLGFNQAEIEYTPRNRIHGETKYTLRKMASLAVSGLTGFSVFPLRLVAVVGFIICFTSFSYAIYAVGLKIFTSQTVPGWSSIMAGIYFLGGLQLAALGVCGEYIGKIFLEVKQRPHYIVAESLLPDSKNL